MELEAPQGINSKVRALGAQIVVLTPELERYTRALHKKLNLRFDILNDLHLKTAEQFRLVTSKKLERTVGASEVWSGVQVSRDLFRAFPTSRGSSDR